MAKPRPCDLTIGLTAGYEVVAGMVPEVPAITDLLRRGPWWARWVFVIVFSGAVLLHLRERPVVDAV
jgi:hypothetical protein